MLRLLSIDGGGMKGITSLMALQRLEHYIQYYSGNKEAKLSDYFDLIGGTSTGAIIGALLLIPDKKKKATYFTEDILELYLSHGEEIFNRPLRYTLRSVFGLLGPKYKSTKFEQLLEQYVGDTVLEDLVKDGMFTSYDTERRQAILYSTLTKKDWQRQEYRIKDIVLSSTAAPTYFPPVHIDSKREPNNCHVDGGIILNNPSLSLVIESLKHPNYTSLSDIVLVSVGNVSNPEYYPYKKVKRRGMLCWAMPLLNILLDSDVGCVDYQVEKLYEALNCKKNYLRMEVMTKNNVPSMDDVSKEAINKLVAYGDQMVGIYQNDMKKLAKRLVENK